MLKEEKEKIKDYFGSFNMMNDDSCLCLTLPTTWVIPDNIDDDIYVNTERASQGIYLLCTDSDPKILFAMANKIIELNKTIEEKRKLFIERINELEKLFNETDINRLKNLEFTFKEEDETTDVKKDEKVEIKETKKDKKINKKSSMMIEAEKIIEEDDLV